MHDTIAAISTPLSQGGIGIVRISGENAREIASKVFIPFSHINILTAAGYTAHYGKIINKDEKIDDGIALLFAAPASFTGEDVVELSCHGGVFVVKSVLRAVLNAGARLAEAGEFTKRAFLNGKLSLTQAEAVMDIISASGEQALNAANAAKEGALYTKIKEIIEKLTISAAQISAFIDFPEEGLPDMDIEAFLSLLYFCKEDLQRLIDTFDKGRIIREGIECVIVGRPNVGKSTLMNLLSGCERSIVTEAAGTTRDVVEEVIKLGECMLRLSDTAGIRNTEDVVETIGVKKAKDKIQTASLVFAVFDASEELTQDDKDILEMVKAKKTIIIVNKTDLKTKLDVSELESYGTTVFISAANDEGIDALKTAVEDLANTAALDCNAAILANERQKQCVLMAKAALVTMLDDYKAGQPLDAISVLLDDAIGELLKLTGESVSETVINEVFNRFCIGK